MLKAKKAYYKKNIFLPVQSPPAFTGWLLYARILFMPAILFHLYVIQSGIISILR